MGSFEELQELMIKYHFRPEKKLSQFFCINEALLHFMARSAELKESDVVLEVGPGTGFLTKILLKKCKVVAIEKDEIIYEVLLDIFKEEIASGQLNLINADAMETDFEKLGVNKVVCLPPYHISSILLTKIMMSKLELAVIVFDIGFLEKVMAFEGFKQYNALTVLTNINAKGEILENIDSNSFFPKPNCTSGVLKLKFKIKNNSKEFFFFLKELFRYKNKDLSRALEKSHQFLEKEIKLKKDGFKEIQQGKMATDKVYALSPEQLLKVYETIAKK